MFDIVFYLQQYSMNLITGLFKFSLIVFETYTLTYSIFKANNIYLCAFQKFGCKTMLFN